MADEHHDQTQQPDETPQSSALSRYFRNLLSMPRDFRDSAIRHGMPDSDRARSQVIFTNLFLHIMPTRMHRYSLRMRATLGLGVISLAMFVLLVATGIPLMVYYKPSVDEAYNSMKEIQYVVPTGRFVRNIHRWAAHGMVACVMLHMARAFYTSAYKGYRKFNWVVGMILFVLTLALSFTGYLLPWDQLALWGVSVGTNMVRSMPLVGEKLRFVFLGGNVVGEHALLRFYVLHCVILPGVLGLLVGVHLWRIRKDGGLR